MARQTLAAVEGQGLAGDCRIGIVAEVRCFAVGCEFEVAVVGSQIAEQGSPLQTEEEGPQAVRLETVLGIAAGLSVSFVAEMTDLDMELDFEKAAGRIVAVERKHHPAAGTEGPAVEADYSPRGS